MSSRIRSCAVASAIGRSSAKLRRSPLTEYCRAGNVTFRPPPVRRSHTPKPISFRPSNTPSVKCSSASASLPGGFCFVVERNGYDHGVLRFVASRQTWRRARRLPLSPSSGDGGNARRGGDCGRAAVRGRKRRSANVHSGCQSSQFRRVHAPGGRGRSPCPSSG